MTLIEDLLCVSFSKITWCYITTTFSSEIQEYFNDSNNLVDVSIRGRGPYFMSGGLEF